MCVFFVLLIVSFVHWTERNRYRRKVCFCWVKDAFSKRLKDTMRYSFFDKHLLKSPTKCYIMMKFSLYGTLTLHWAHMLFVCHFHVRVVTVDCAFVAGSGINSVIEKTNEFNIRKDVSICKARFFKRSSCFISSFSHILNN